MGTLHWNLTA